jgi:lipoate-protein ligase B
MGNNKMGSIGIAIRKGVSFHGLALNVNLSLEPFTWINPCGLDEVGMTSIKKESKRDVSMQDARQAFIKHFAIVFEVSMVDASLHEVERLLKS